MENTHDLLVGTLSIGIPSINMLFFAVLLAVAVVVGFVVSQK